MVVIVMLVRIRVVDLVCCLDCVIMQIELVVSSLDINVVVGILNLDKKLGVIIIMIDVFIVVFDDMLMILGLVSGLENSVCMMVLVIVRLVFISRLRIMCGKWICYSIDLVMVLVVDFLKMILMMLVVLMWY